VYQTPGPGLVTLRVFDILGREVSSLVNAVQPAGSHSATFSGSGMGSGVYVYRLTTPYGSLVKSMILLR